MAFPPGLSQTTGLRRLRVAIAVACIFGLGLTMWVFVHAWTNPDVRSRRPDWMERAAGFDASYWIPLALTVVSGMMLVLAVFVRAYRRVAAGEDIYESRLGRGVRRRGERHIPTDSEQL